MAPIVQQEFLGIWSGLSGRHPHAGWWAVMADRLVRLFSEASLSELSKQDMSVVHNFLRHALYVTCTRLTGSDAECFADGSYPKAVVSIAALDNAFLETRYWEQIQNSSLVHCVAPLYERLTERKLRWRGWRPPESHLINWAGTHLEGVDGVVLKTTDINDPQWSNPFFKRELIRFYAVASIHVVDKALDEVLRAGQRIHVIVILVPQAQIRPNEHGQPQAQKHGYL